MMNRLFSLFAFCFTATNGHGTRSGWVKPPTPAGVTGNDFQYEMDGSSYTGYVAFPTQFDKTSLVKGTLLAHQWYGLGDMEKYRCGKPATCIKLIW